MDNPEPSKGIMKHCLICDSEYQPTGPAAKYCPVCADMKRKESYERMLSKRRTGVGRGQKRGEAHCNFKHGRYTYETARSEIKQEIGRCERCDKDLREATHYQWVIHHKDHNQYNYSRENLELLCKRCHQIEHKCHKAFEGATTISKESRAKRPEAPDSQNG